MKTDTSEPPKTDGRRRISWKSRVVAAVLALILVGAVGAAVFDMVGQSERENAEVSGGVARASMAARDFGFVPRLVVTEGVLPLRLSIDNQGVHTHTFTVDELGIDVVIPRGATKVVTIDLPGTGRYVFTCRFHEAFGMRGYVVVRAAS
ncbi:MAG: cupredoxin domain-containing protein [Actinomycetota bacterium]